jgi:hypothetical protein
MDQLMEIIKYLKIEKAMLTVPQDKASQEMLLSAKYSQLLRDSNRVATEERDHFKTKLEEVSL